MSFFGSIVWGEWLRGYIFLCKVVFCVVSGCFWNC